MASLVFLPLPPRAGIADMCHHTEFILTLIDVPLKTTLCLETLSARLPHFSTLMTSQVHLLQEPLKGAHAPEAGVEMAGGFGATQGSVALPTVMFLETDTPICLLQGK